MKQHHITIINIPAYGHVNPTLALVEKLCEKGHRVTYATTEEFAPAVQQAGARPLLYETTISVDPQQIKELMEKNETPLMFLKESLGILPQLEELYKDDQPDLIVYDFIALAGKLLADKLQVPAVRLCSSYAQNESFQMGTEEMLKQVKEAEAEFQAFLEQENLPAVSFEQLAIPEAFNIVFMPRSFQIKNETFDDRFCFIGPSLGKRSEQERLLLKEKGDRPLMLISLGTAFNAWPEFYQMCMEAFGGSEWHVIMSVGKSIEPDSLGDIPDNFTVRQRVPQLDVLTEADVFISHGGMNSTMEAMNEGVPLVVIPQMHEQELTAQRVEELGLGIYLPKEEVSVPRLQQAIGNIFSDKEIHSRVKDMQKDVKEAGGAEQGAAEIEAFMKKSVVPQ
ncbi:macrolide family glycosyltransferase [Bacillus atrophaeus]|uniref:Glycosyltransferase n=1 Tax=Bacillus atrophaeus (strain 1942) TaxID=720555 RepID=A0ABM5LVE2_BACA1|nr:macrolide family glycosyltransferase [Bacillus atrophaeus]AMR63355.1 UDP-glucosyltransferase [Bacillus subtilis subsp. globigii]ADP31706.1 putative glycosyltransferase [Bacillus atrophaeus 1942]AIK47254.1 oleandomycin glycosyltransferase [Bacillus atrophaeus subsp. globigii]EIM10293.1 putative glycosyltransferase [Bacillus atrophaeus C89]KFK82935.1 oleandomycin glycosyltransferase [Bacillus atrophaeus]